MKEAADYTKAFHSFENLASISNYFIPTDQQHLTEILCPTSSHTTVNLLTASFSVLL